MEEFVYLNGSLVPRSQARISPFDYGFLYGYALFETMRAYEGRVFRLRQHLERLSASAQVMGLPLPKLETLEAAVNETLSANGLRSARVRLSISAGEGEAVPNIASCREPTVFITARSLAPLPDFAYEEGYRAVVSSLRQNALSPLSRLKSANYLLNLLARTEAQRNGYQEAIILNEKGNVAEGSISSLFLVKNEVLLTPDSGSGCLPGITR
ncbi:MAG: aminotransferase class IV, partial [Chloroflexota bacterium]